MSKDSRISQQSTSSISTNNNTCVEIISSNPEHNGWRCRTLGSIKYNNLVSSGYVRNHCTSSGIINENIDPKDICTIISTYLDFDKKITIELNNDDKSGQTQESDCPGRYTSNWTTFILNRKISLMENQNFLIRIVENDCQMSHPCCKYGLEMQFGVISMPHKTSQTHVQRKTQTQLQKDQNNSKSNIKKHDSNCKIASINMNTNNGINIKNDQALAFVDMFKSVVAKNCCLPAGILRDLYPMCNQANFTSFDDWKLTKMHNGGQLKKDETIVLHIDSTHVTQMRQSMRWYRNDGLKFYNHVFFNLNRCEYFVAIACKMCLCYNRKPICLTIERMDEKMFDKQFKSVNEYHGISV